MVHPFYFKDVFYMHLFGLDECEGFTMSHSVQDLHSKNVSSKTINPQIATTVSVLPADWGVRLS
jgi:hypothetical protein